MKFREHRGSLEDSMATCVDIEPTCKAIIHHLRERYEHSNKRFHFLCEDAMSIEYYEGDERIGWESSYIISDKQGVIGFCNQIPHKLMDQNIHKVDQLTAILGENADKLVNLAQRTEGELQLLRQSLVISCRCLIYSFGHGHCFSNRWIRLPWDEEQNRKWMREFCLNEFASSYSPSEDVRLHNHSMYELVAKDLRSKSRGFCFRLHPLADTLVYNGVNINGEILAYTRNLKIMAEISIDSPINIAIEGNERIWPDLRSLHV